MTYTIYVLRCADGSLYTGIARDLEARIAAHNRGAGARYTRGRGPVTLVWKRSRQAPRAAAKVGDLVHGHASSSTRSRPCPAAKRSA